MFDAAGRVWITTSIRGSANPDYCKEGSSNTFAQYYPLARSAKQAGYYDPKTQKFTLIDRRRTAVSGLVPDRDRHQRRRQDHEAME